MTSCFNYEFSLKIFFYFKINSKYYFYIYVLGENEYGINSFKLV